MGVSTGFVSPPPPGASGNSSMCEPVASSEFKRGNSGLLQVTVIKADNLSIQKEGRTLDPYVHLALGREKKKTKIMWKTSTPVWNETFEFIVQDDRKDVLVCKVYDKERFRIDAAEGQLRLPIHEIIELAGSSPPFIIKRTFKLAKAKLATLTLDLKYFQKQIRASVTPEQRSQSLSPHPPRGEGHGPLDEHLPTVAEKPTGSGHKFLKWIPKINWGKKHNNGTHTPITSPHSAPPPPPIAKQARQEIIVDDTSPDSASTPDRGMSVSGLGSGFVAMKPGSTRNSTLRESKDGQLQPSTRGDSSPKGRTSAPM